MIEELSNGNICMTWAFEKSHWEEMNALAGKLGYADTEEMFSDVTLGFLQKNGLDPTKWI